MTVGHVGHVLHHSEELHHTIIEGTVEGRRPRNISIEKRYRN